MVMFQPDYIRRLIELGTRLKLPAFLNPDGSRKYRDYPDFVVNFFDFVQNSIDPRPVMSPTPHTTASRSPVLSRDASSRST